MTSDRVTTDELPERPDKQWTVQRLSKVRLGDQSGSGETTDIGLQASAETRSEAPLPSGERSGEGPCLTQSPLTPALSPGGRGASETASGLMSEASPGIADVGVAQVDLDRARRCGFPEVVFGQGKSPEAIAKIFDALLAAGAEALATRIDPAQAESLRAKFPTGRYNEMGRTFRVKPARRVAPALGHSERSEESRRTSNIQRSTSNVERQEENSTLDVGRSTLEVRSDRGRVTIVTAGTSDLPVAEEARETADWMGAEVTLVCDVGVAGPQRLPAHLEKLQSADAVVVVAGMEGALPSVVGGHVACPVIAVPTSVGYGANLGGIAALLAMLNSCAANVTVVNIDAGFKGGYLAGLIARRIAEARSHAALVSQAAGAR